MNIPQPLIATISDILSNHYSHAELDNLFMHANAPGEPPSESRKNKVTQWLIRCNNTCELDALAVLGKLIENYMEQVIPEVETFTYEHSAREEEWKRNRQLIQTALAKHNLSYFTGGYIRQAGSKGPSKTLEDVLKAKNMPAVDEEFRRTVANIESDPPAALTGACAIVEALCKVYIEANDDLALPNKQTISSLWDVVKRHLGLDPQVIVDQDLRKIIQGTSSIVEGLGALRTHVGSAHGHGNARYKLQPRHVRLAVNSAHTLVTFVIETWDQRKGIV